MNIRGLLVLILVVCGSLLASPTAQAHLRERDVHEYILPNGMKWLLVNRPDIPIFSGVLSLRVGGLDESGPPAAGLAHMFEHMAFKGSRVIGTKNYAKESIWLTKLENTARAINREREKTEPDEKHLELLLEEFDRYQSAAQRFVDSNEVWRTFTTNGAAHLNAFTSKDQTAYLADMPANKLELWLYMTSEMVFYPVMREFYRERNVVLEERRSSVDTSPTGQVMTNLLDLAFTASPYRWSVIGTLESVSRLTATDALNFHKHYYRPDQMVGVIVGAMDIVQTKKLISKYYNVSLPPSEKKVITEEPPQEGERIREIYFDSEPLLWMAFHKPNAPHVDDYIFDLISYIMCDSGSSRLKREVVEKQKLATNIGCSAMFPGSRLPNLFVVGATPASLKKMEKMDKRILKEFRKLAKSGVTHEELAKAKNNLSASILWRIESNAGLAQQLANDEVILGNWRYLADYSDVISKITSDDIKRVAAQYLTTSNRSVVMLKRSEK